MFSWCMKKPTKKTTNKTKYKYFDPNSYSFVYYM